MSEQHNKIFEVVFFTLAVGGPLFVELIVIAEEWFKKRKSNRT